MDNIAIVVQRYGKEINGGAEVHARMLAEHLKERYHVDVLTSCSLDYHKWDNHYTSGEEMMDGVRVLRFTHEKADPDTPRRLGRYLRGNWKYYHIRYTLNNFISLTIRRIRYRKRRDHDSVFESWMENNGPVCKKMISYIEQEKDRYRSFIFFTYLFYPTYFGLQKAFGKSIFIPLAHDEPTFYLSGFGKIFSLPRFIMYNSESEKKLVESIYPVTQKIRSDIAGVGFKRPSFTESLVRPVASPYFVYIGRIDIGKGCLELMDYFTRMNKERRDKLKLIMIGKNHIDSPVKRDNIIFTGFVDEAVKHSYLQHCEALIIPSRYESLSMVTLEAMSVGKTVLANGYCEVLKDHIERSKAGFVYYNGKDFGESIETICRMSDREREVIAQYGRSYVEKNYKWEIIMKKFDAAIDYVGTGRETLL